MNVSKQIPKLKYHLFLPRILKTIPLEYVHILKTIFIMSMLRVIIVVGPNGWKQLLMGYILEVYSSEVRNNKHGLSNDISEQESYYFVLTST